MRNALRALVATLVASGLTTSEARSQITAPRATLTQLYRIDGAQDDLTRIGVILPFADGRLAITQPRDSRILIYDAQGKRTAVAGRAGSGPGEFESLGYGAQGLVGDSVWVYEANNRRMSLFTSKGTFVRSTVLLHVVRPQSASGPAIDASPWPVARLPDGSIVTRANHESERTDALTRMQGRPSQQLVLATDSGVVRKTVAFIPPPVGQLEIRRRDFMSTPAIPFAATPLESVARDGTRVAFLTTQFGNGAAGTVRVVALRINGDTLATRSFPFTAVRIAAGVVDSEAAFYDQLKGRWPDDVVTDVVAAIKKYAPSFYPPVAKLDAGLEGTTWVCPHAPTESPVCVLLDERLAPVMSVALAKGEGFVTGSRSRIWTIVKDADGLESVVAYRVAR